MPTLAASLWLARDGLIALLLLLCCAGPGRLLVGRLPGLDRAERRVLADSMRTGGVPPLSPFAALLLPLGAALAWPSARTRWLASIALVYLALWVFSPRDPRFLAPMTGPMAVLAVVAGSRWLSGTAPRRSRRGGPGTA